MKLSLLEKSTAQFGWIVLSVVFQSAAALFAKLAAQYATGTGLSGLWAIVYNPYYACEIVALGLQFFSWTRALKRFPLSFAYPFMSFVCIINLVWSSTVFNETVHAKHVVGIAIISVGIGCILWNREK